MTAASLEWSFWGLVLIGAFASAMFVFFDDGSRVMSASYPLIVMSWSSGLATRWTLEVEKLPSKNGLVLGCSTVTLVLLAYLVVPWIMHAAAPTAVVAEETKANQQIVFGGSRVTGILVIADGTEPPVDVPAISYSKLSKVIDQSNVQIYQPLITPVHPTLPFAFVMAPRREAGRVSKYQLIAPPEILLERNVQSWKLTTVDWDTKPGYGAYWFLVTKAERLR